MSYCLVLLESTCLAFLTDLLLLLHEPSSEDKNGMKTRVVLVWQALEKANNFTATKRPQRIGVSASQPAMCAVGLTTLERVT